MSINHINLSQASYKTQLTMRHQLVTLQETSREKQLGVLLAFRQHGRLVPFLLGAHPCWMHGTLGKTGVTVNINRWTPRHATALLRIWEREWLKCYMISCEKGVKKGSILCRSGLGQAASEAKLSAIQNTAAYVCCCSRYAHSMNVFRSSTPLHVNLNGDNGVPTAFEWWFQCWFHQPATSIFI